MKLSKNKFTFLINIIVICMLFTSSAFAKSSLVELENKLKAAQAENNMEKIVNALNAIIKGGYPSWNTYKALGDLYFFLKKDDQGLKVFHEAAKWSNTSKDWEHYADLLLWKKKAKKGREALEKAVSLDPGNQKLFIKLLNHYEYIKFIDKAEKLWAQLYKESNKDHDIGDLLVAFYLRNGKVVKARNLIEELIQIHGELKTLKRKVTYLKTLVWSGKVHSAYAQLVKIPVNEYAEADLEYFFTLSLTGGNIELAEQIIDRIEKSGKEVWLKRLKLATLSGDPKHTRSLIEDKMDEKGETAELFQLLIETYRAERRIEAMAEVVQEYTYNAYKDLKWINWLMAYYLLNEKFEYGIDHFEDIIDDSGGTDQIKFNLAKLYRENGDYDSLEEILEEIEDESLKVAVLRQKLDYYYFRDDLEKIYETNLELLKYISKEAPEDILANEVKKEEIHGEYQFNESDSIVSNKEVELADQYVDILNELTYRAELIGLSEKITEHGRTSYNTLKSRYAKYPTKKRLLDIIAVGERFANDSEREQDLKLGIEEYGSHYFTLQYFRFLKRKKRETEALETYKRLLALSVTTRERRLTAEHTFGFIPYDTSKELFSALVKKDPKYYMGLKRLGQIGLYTKDYNTAAINFEVYLKINRYDTEILFSQGEVFNILREYDKIEDNLETAVGILLKTNRSYSENERLALCYIRLEEFEKAFAAIKDALNQFPEGISLKLNKMEILGYLEDWNGLIKYVEEEGLENYEPLLVGLNIFAAYAALGEEEKARQKIEELYKKHPKDKDVIASFAYFTSEHGYDVEALKYLKEAAELPPLNRELNQDYRNIKGQYSDRVEVNHTQVESDSTEYATQQIIAGLMVGKTDRLEVTAKQYAGTNLTTDSSVSKTNVLFGYHGKLPGRQKYQVYLAKADKVGYQLGYQTGYKGVTLNSYYFGRIQNQDSVSAVDYETYQSGYGLDLGFQSYYLRQEYDLTYSSIDFEHIEDSILKRSNQITLGANFTQSLLKYPHLCLISFSWQERTVEGDENTLFENHSEVSSRFFYEYNWTEFFKTSGETYLANDSEANKEMNGGGVKAEYRGDEWTFYLGLEKNEETTAVENADPVTTESTTISASINRYF